MLRELNVNIRNNKDNAEIKSYLNQSFLNKTMSKILNSDISECSKLLTSDILECSKLLTSDVLECSKLLTSDILECSKILTSDNITPKKFVLLTFWTRINQNEQHSKIFISTKISLYWTKIHQNTLEQNKFKKSWTCGTLISNLKTQRSC